MDGFDRRLDAIRKSAPKISALDTSVENSRFAPRRRDNTPAQIAFNGSSLSLPCHVVDMSTTGARLRLRPGWDRPFGAEESLDNHVTLMVRPHRVKYDCKIIRREANFLGVKFTAVPQPL